MSWARAAAPWTTQIQRDEVKRLSGTGSTVVVTDENPTTKILLFTPSLSVVSAYGPAVLPVELVVHVGQIFRRGVDEVEELGVGELPHFAFDLAIRRKTVTTQMIDGGALQNREH